MFRNTMLRRWAYPVFVAIYLPLFAGLALMWASHVPPPGAQASPQEISYHVTAYLWTGDVMYSGIYPFSGAAACSRRWAIGTQFVMWDGAIFTCLDRGLLDEYGVDLDLFAWSYSEAVYLMARYDNVPFHILE